MHKIAAAILILMGVAGSAMAGFPTPEIDPASGVGALAVIGGAVLIIRSRRRRA